MAKKLQMCGTEEEMREVAAKICRNYLHGAWKNVDPNEMYFSKVNGGLSNFLYLVGLPEDPRKVPSYHIRESSPEDEDKCELKSPSFVLEEPHKNLNVLLFYSLSVEKHKKCVISLISGLVSAINGFRRSGCAATIRRLVGGWPLIREKVLLRIYGQVHGERAMDAIVTESVIFTLLSERKLGPRLYGVFSGGRIEEYIPARPLLPKELADPAISMKIAEKMAAIHSLELPLSKDPNWIWKNCYKWLKTVKEDQASGGLKGKNPEEERIIKMMGAVDFDKELKWLKKFLATVDSPVVFCHNDMQQGNILIFDDMGTTNQSDTGEGVEDKDLSSFEDANTSDSILSRMSDSGEPRMVFIDYEYCAYNYRGFDLANHFQEWALDYSNPVHPFYHFNEDDFPTLEQKEIFIKEYLKHYHANLSDNKELNPPTVDQVNQLLYEVEAYALSSHLLWTLWSCVNAPKSQIPFGYWEYGQTRLDMYYRLKQEVIKKGNGVAQKRKICEVDI
ncbi:unnamed protein product [Arctia plantaginis]|uniref:Choline/ethanolamine kinase n=1 Tax=Arctia plantaginis TaxID=874455 RepID=A0A8S0ZP27_ARCPL|nr:unnamed protein product [Arctia plantaginis]